MNHDIAHCGEESCKRKDTCKRYIAYLEAVKNNFEYCTYLFIDDVDKCKNYWEYKIKE